MHIVYNFKKQNILRQTLYVDICIYAYWCIRLIAHDLVDSWVCYIDKTDVYICFRVISYIVNVFTVRNPYKGTMGVVFGILKPCGKIVDRTEKICLRCFEGWKNLDLHPGRLTWNLKITHLERKMIFQTSMRTCSMLIFQGVNESLVFSCTP